MGRENKKATDAEFVEEAAGPGGCPPAAPSALAADAIIATIPREDNLLTDQEKEFANLLAIGIPERVAAVRVGIGYARARELTSSSEVRRYIEAWLHHLGHNQADILNTLFKMLNAKMLRTVRKTKQIRDKGKGVRYVTVEETIEADDNIAQLRAVELLNRMLGWDATNPRLDQPPPSVAVQINNLPARPPEAGQAEGPEEPVQAKDEGPMMGDEAINLKGDALKEYLRKFRADRREWLLQEQEKSKRKK